MGVITPILAKEFNTIQVPQYCQKFSELNNALPNNRAEQSVCTDLDQNAITHSLMLGSKNVRQFLAQTRNMHTTW
jgi:hypothetical protein